LTGSGRATIASLVHAFGAALHNPDLLVACVIGDGAAKTAVDRLGRDIAALTGAAVSA